MANTADSVTGDWKQFTFHMATNEDCPRITQHLGDHFMPHEPANKYFIGDVWNSAHQADIRGVVEHLLKDGLSIYVTPKDSDQIIAVNLLIDSRSPEPPPMKQPKAEITRILCGIFDQYIEQARPAFESKFRSDFHADIFFTSTDAKYGGQGIATEMYHRTFRLLRNKGFTVVKSDFSHPATRAIGNKFGFVELNRLYLKDKVDENGKKLFSSEGDDEFILHAAKRL